MNPLHRTALSVNVNKVALLRNSRPLDEPNVLHACRLCLQAGADGITVHPRPDERHIRRQDVFDIKQLMLDWPDAEYNIEGNPFHNLMEFVRQVRPHQATFVPDSTTQSTSDHGWNLAADRDRLVPLIEECHRHGVRVSLFMDADSDAMGLAKELGADRVELYTEPWARAFGTCQQTEVLESFVRAAQAATEAGLLVNAGHDLNRANLTSFLVAIPNIAEVSIGHALIGDALELGYAQTVAEYQACIDAAGQGR